jgi:diguanylate cyclase (GGDEF)-like protein/PAS domain S-box-containing protein
VLRQRVWLTAVAVLFSLVGLIVALALFVRHAQIVRDATALQSQLTEWQGRLQSVQVALTNAETGQRGYLLTADDQYLAPYDTALHELPQILQALRNIPVPDDTLMVHIAEIRRLADLKLAELAETVRLSKSGDHAGAIALVQTGTGRQYMRQLRDHIDLLSAAAGDRSRAIAAQIIRGSDSARRWALITAAALILAAVTAAIQAWMLLRAQSVHAKSLQELTDIFDRTPDYVAQTDWLGRMVYINPAALRALGLPADFDVRGHMFTEFYTADTNRRWMTEIIPAVKRDGVWVGETKVLLHGEGVPVNHAVIAHRGPLGRISRYSSIMRNISRQVAARDELARQTATLGAIVEAIPAMVAVWDTDLRCRLVNRAVERWHGKSRDRMVGSTLEQIASPLDYERGLPWFRRALAGETVVQERDYPETAQIRHLSCTYTPLHLADGSIGGVISIALDVTQEREENIRLARLSERDPLTGLLNRAGFEGCLTHYVAQGDLPTLVVLYIDLDHFKPVNDRHGHAAGDEVLRQFAERLRGVVRPTDAVARLGGDEFGVVLAGVRSASAAAAVAEKVVALASVPFEVGGHSVNIGASVGVASGAGCPGWVELVAQADAMAYAAKAGGRGRSVVAQGGEDTSMTVSQRMLQLQTGADS